MKQFHFKKYKMKLKNLRYLRVDNATRDIILYFLLLVIYLRVICAHFSIYVLQMFFLSIFPWFQTILVIDPSLLLYGVYLLKSQILVSSAYCCNIYQEMLISILVLLPFLHISMTCTPLVGSRRPSTCACGLCTQ